MLVDQQILRIPGSTPIQPVVQRAMTKPIIEHMGYCSPTDVLQTIGAIEKLVCKR